MATGGTFANGAVTAAFGYLFNELGSYKERGYAATVYQDGTVYCNGSTERICSFDASGRIYQSNVDIDIALGVGAGVAARSARAAAGAGVEAVGEALGPTGWIFGRERLGGSSLMNINSNDYLRIGWGWVGDAQTGTNVFRIGGEWLRELGFKNPHIDLFKWSPK